MWKKLWRWLNPRDLTDDEIESLNVQIAKALNQERKNIDVHVISWQQLNWVVGGEAWGAAWPSGQILVKRYGADEHTARKFEDF
jgi:hypothetical protein